MPDPEMKFDSTFRLFSVLLTFNISARACGQEELAVRQAGAEQHRTAELQLPSLPEHSWRIPHAAVSLPPDGTALREGESLLL